MRVHACFALMRIWRRFRFRYTQNKRVSEREGCVPLSYVIVTNDAVKSDAITGSA